MLDCSTPSTAYSYIRFSHPDQAKGDSLRRQAESAADWCQRNGVLLDASTTFRDLGKSAYAGKHRENPDRHALAAFLKLVENGQVARGSYLILENLDRLSREHIQPALLLVLNLLQAGVRIVQLKPTEMVFDESSGTLPVLMMMMELSRGHGESALKSERVGKAWQERKKRAREEGKILTHRLPAWIEERAGKLYSIPARAAIIRRIFALAANGYGQVAILREFHGEGVKPFGPRPWSRSYLNRILNDRRVLGELQPRTGRGTRLDGEVVPNYFPAIVSEAQWLAARVGQEHRYKTRGRPAREVNVFAGLLTNARTGDAYYRATRPTGSNDKRRFQKLLINRDAIEGRAEMHSFPFDTFEKAILSCLREVDPRELLDGEKKPDESLMLTAELTRVEASIRVIVEEMDARGESPELFKRLRVKEAKREDLREKQRAARHETVHPLRESWGEARTLLAALESATDPHDTRLRLKSVLGRVVERIYLLVVSRGAIRLCVAQTCYKSIPAHRLYLIRHQPTKANASGRVPGFWQVASLRDDAVMRPIPTNAALADLKCVQPLRDWLDHLFDSGGIETLLSGCAKHPIP